MTDLSAQINTSTAQDGECDEKLVTKHIHRK